ncbi:MAG: PBP1A family penicillin-binding protein [Desulfobacterales bacterium]|nr:PBP1A family penicillin-binding protein [Desulfobacterales bacterium]
MQIKKTDCLIFIIVAIGIITGVCLGFFLSLMHDLPQINSLKQFKPAGVTNVYSNTNQLISQFYLYKRFPVLIDKIAPDLIDALVSTEDRLFFSHPGINFKSIARALIKDITAMSLKQGASTLTQQLAKTLFLSPEKTLIRKVKEAILTLQIERRYTKNEILELYLNQIYFGNGAYGVEAAANTFFNKKAKDLTLSESALIAGIPKAPSLYSPLNNFELATKRRKIVLKQMFETKKISSQEYHTALNENIIIKKPDENQTIAPYFIEHIKASLKNKFNKQNIYTESLSIYTTLNVDMQKTAEKSVSEWITQQKKRLKSKKDKNSAHANLTEPQCAFIAIDPISGQISAMVGGTDFETSKFNRTTLAKRQPGSAFKPLIYAYAIQKGFSQNSTILDTPLSYSKEAGTSQWNVKNYSNSYAGEITLRKALALSKNTCAVRLLEELGADQIINFASKAGIKSVLKPNRSLALGTSEVSLLELTSAYTVFANMGTWIEPFAIAKITDSNNKILYIANPEKRNVMSRQDSAIITDMLQAVIREGTGQKASFIKKSIAGKTGTTDEYKDALFIGFSPEIVAGVWVGNDDSTSLGRFQTGAKAALPIWINFMEKVLFKKEYQFFDIPDNTKMIYMDPDTGKIFTKPEKHSDVKALILIKDT